MEPDYMIKRIKMAEALASIPEKYGKPLICANEHELAGPVFEIFKGKHVPFFGDPMDCAKSMHALVRYAEIKRKLSG